MKTRSQNNEYKWTHHLYQIATEGYQQEQIQQPHSNNGDTEEQKCDAINRPDDTTLKLQDAAHIYPKLIAFKEATRKYKLPINWIKVVILVKNITAT